MIYKKEISDGIQYVQYFFGQHKNLPRSDN